MLALLVLSILSVLSFTSAAASAQTLALTADATSLLPGQTATLSWRATGATSCIASLGWSGAKSTSGSQSVTPAVDTSYTLTCSGAGGSATRTVTVAVATGTRSFPVNLFQTGATLPEEGTVIIDAAKPTGASEARLSLTVFDGDTAGEGEFYVNGNGPVALFDDQLGGDASTHTATYTTPGPWWNDGPNMLRFVHTATQGFRVNNAVVSFTGAAATAPTLALSANPAALISGQSATLSWSATDATGCIASQGWGGAKGTSGSQRVAPVADTAYTLSCSGAGGNATQTVTVAVTAATGSFPVDFFQTGATLPEEGTVTIQAAKPTGASEAQLSLTAFDGDTADEGELYVNGNGPVTLFGNQATDSDASSHTATYVTPASWWNDGPNRLRFVHTATHGFRLDGASVSFTSTTATAPTLRLSADPASLVSGQSAMLSWSATEATGCLASQGWGGAKSTSGSESVAPAVDTAYSLSCSGPGGGASATVTVAVTAATGSFPVDFFQTGATLPEQGTVTIRAAKPTGASHARLSLTAFDGDTAGEGELYVNGNGPVALFDGHLGGDASIHTATYTTPASWWNDGPNALRFVHTSTHGFRVDSAAVSFSSDSAALPGCLANFAGPEIALAGDHGYRGFRVGRWDDRTRFDARGGVWTTMMNGFDDRRGLVPIQIGADWGTNIDGAGRRDLWSSQFNTPPQPTAFCFFGGTIIGTQPLNATWGETKRLGGAAAITINGARGSVVEGVRIHNHHDAFVPYRNDGFTLRGNWVSYNRDDCIENDANAEGTVEDNLFDGCYVFYSGTTSRSATTRPHGAGASGTLRIVGNLIKMQNMPGPFDRNNQLGDRSRSGYGDFWKTRPGAGVPKIVLRDNVIAFENPRNQGATRLTGVNVNIVECANNTILWLGSGSFPGQLPSGVQDCFRIVTGSQAQERWRELRQQWIAAHPDVARL